MYGLVQGRPRAMAYDASTPSRDVHTWAFRLLDNWIWIWSVTMRLFVFSQRFPKWLFAQDLCSVNRDLGEGKKPSALEQSSNYMIRLLRSEMEGIQQKVPVWCVRPQPPLRPLCWHGDPHAVCRARAVIARNMRRRQAGKAKEETVGVSFAAVRPSEAILNLS